jgi:hypothetical protein
MLIRVPGTGCDKSVCIVFRLVASRSKTLADRCHVGD